ncbi:MAG: glycosyltransferase family 1 protein [Proteobacteria bacterium]|nr:glycosyltransferase family 1 protein [Pseudomonadota bacterium]
MKALLLHHPYVYPRFEQDFVWRIGELPEFDIAACDLNALSRGVLATSGQEIVLQAYDVVVVFVAFKALRAAETLDWRAFAGLRVLMDHDIIQNYSDIFGAGLLGAWPPVFRKHRFDSVVTSGGLIQERLNEEGIPSDWTPKAFEPARFADLAGPRQGLVTYGSAYLCRQIAERAVRDAKLPLTRIAMTPYLDLGAALNRYLACMAISSDLEVPTDERAGLASSVARAIPMRPGLEPMAKFFEASGVGCCPIADDMSDLHELGFRDGETMLAFRSHDELVAKLEGAGPQALRDIGAGAANFVHNEHTWAHRARTLRAAITRRL